LSRRDTDKPSSRCAIASGYGSVYKLGHFTQFTDLNHKPTMKTNSPLTHALIALFVLLMAVGCSKKSADTSNAADESENPEVAGKKMTKETDEMVEEILKGTDKMEAADWLKKYPRSAIGENEEGQDLLLAPIVASLKQAGAKRVVIEYVTLGQAQLLAAMVVVLPTDPPARQKLFALEPKLSELCQQTPVIDRGQKYLYYSFD
jgi:hypothetical protein